MTYHVDNIKKAWALADKIFPTDYMKDDRKSERAGYDIYTSTAIDNYSWISDLGTSLEVNFDNGETHRIVIDEPNFKEYQIEDALKVISDAIYQIDDKVDYKLGNKVGILTARNTLYKAYAQLKEILDTVNPDSVLYKTYNL